MKSEMSDVCLCSDSPSFDRQLSRGTEWLVFARHHYERKVMSSHSSSWPQTLCATETHNCELANTLRHNLSFNK